MYLNMYISFLERSRREKKKEMRKTERERRREERRGETRFLKRNSIHRERKERGSERE
jgi:hypothetical protein